MIAGGARSCRCWKMMKAEAGVGDLALVGKKRYVTCRVKKEALRIGKVREGFKFPKKFKTEFSTEIEDVPGEFEERCKALR